MNGLMNVHHPLQFYHEIDESERWLNSELDDIISNFEKLDISRPDDNTVTFFLTEMEVVIVAYNTNNRSLTII